MRRKTSMGRFCCKKITGMLQNVSPTTVIVAFTEFSHSCSSSAFQRQRVTVGRTYTHTLEGCNEHRWTATSTHTRLPRSPTAFICNSKNESQSNSLCREREAKHCFMGRADGLRPCKYAIKMHFIANNKCRNASMTRPP